MPDYQSVRVYVEAVQWNRFGDSPDVFHLDEGTMPIKECPQCKGPPSRHGQIATLEGFKLVCPGNWIITGAKGEKNPMSDEFFKKNFETSKKKNKHKKPASPPPDPPEALAEPAGEPSKDI